MVQRNTHRDRERLQETRQGGTWETERDGEETDWKRLPGGQGDTRQRQQEITRAWEVGNKTWEKGSRRKRA